MSDDSVNANNKNTFWQVLKDSLPCRGHVDSWATRLGVTAILTALTNQGSDFYNEETLLLTYICLALFAILSFIPLWLFFETWWASMRKTKGRPANFIAFCFLVSALAATLVITIPTIGKYISQQVIGLGIITLLFGVGFVLIVAALFAVLSNVSKETTRRILSNRD